MKKTTNRILAVALAVLMAFSCLTAAFATEEKTNDIGYTARGISEFVSNSQCVTYLANMLDEELKKADEEEKAKQQKAGEEVTGNKMVVEVTSGISLTIDYTSIDKIMETIDTFAGILNNPVVKVSAFVFFGDLSKLNFSKSVWTKGLRRKDGDQKVFEQVVNLIASNSELISKFIKGGIGTKDGISLGSLLNKLLEGEDLNLSIYDMLKDALVGTLYNNTDSTAANYNLEKYNEYMGKKLDEFIFDAFIPDLLSGEEQLKDLKINQNDSINTMLINVFNVCWKGYLIPALNNVEIKYDANNALSKAFKDVLNYDFSTIDFSTIAAIDSKDNFIDGVNDVLGEVIKKIVKVGGLTWEKGFDNIGANVKNLFMFLINNADFAGTEYATQAAAAKASNDFDTAALITVKAVLSQVGKEYGEEVQNCKSFKEMAYVVLKRVAKVELELPVEYNDKKDDYLTVAADLLAYIADEIIPMADNVKVGSGASLDAVIDYIANYLQFDKGFAKMLNLKVSKTDSPYKKLNALLWVFYSDTTAEANRIDAEALLKGKNGNKSIFESILALDIQNILNITVVPLIDSISDFNASKLAYSIIKNVLDNLFGQQIMITYPTTTAPIDYALQNENIATVAGNLLTAINKNKSALISTGCYLACLLMDIPATDWVIASGEEYVDGTKSVKLTGTEPDGKTKISRILYLDENFTVGEDGRINGIKSFEGSYEAIAFALKTAPAKVAAVKAAVTDTTATLSWAKVTGATGYTVYNGTKKLADVTANTYKISGLKANTKYSTYKVVAYTKTANGKVLTADATAASLTTAPAAVTGVKASSAETAITLTWTKSAGATSYSVYNTVTKKTAITKTNSIKISGLKANTAYTFNITAIGTANSGVTAFTANTLPAAVTGVKASAITASTANVTWTAVKGATSYTVYDAASKKVLATVKTNSASLTKLKASTTYKIQVKATVGKLTGAYSNAVSFTTLFTQVTGLKVSKVTGNSIAVKWTAVKGATSYKVYLNGKATTVKKATATLSKLKAGTVYSIYVVALKSNTTGQASATIKVGTTPAKLTGLKATASTKLFNKDVTLTWKTVKGATGYNIYQGSKLIGTTTKATYKISNLNKKTTFSFSVEPIIKTADYTTKGAKVTAKA